MLTAPFPASGTYLESIRQSTRALRLASNIQVKAEDIRRLLTSKVFCSSFQRVSAHGLALPLKFASPLAELNLLSILSLLNFGSAYRVPLHVANGRGAWDTIRAFVFALYITSSTGGEGDYMSARGMRTITEGKVAELLGVNVHIERPHESIPGVTTGELGGPLYDVVKLITTTLTGTGEILVSSGYADLGSFVVEALKEGKKARSSGNVDAEVDMILERIVRAFPAFQDMAVINDTPVYCFKKALFLIHAIVVRFGTLSPSLFPIPDTRHIPIFADNVIPSMLVHLGVLDLTSSALSQFFPDARSAERLDSLLHVESRSTEKGLSSSVPKLVPKEGPVLTRDQAYILRASAIDACEIVVDFAHSTDLETSEGEPLGWIKKVTLPDLDGWLWSVAKDRLDYRNLERFVERDTVFF